MIEAALYARLSASTALTALTQGRIFPTTPTEDSPGLPLCVYRITDSEPQLTTQGASGVTKYTATIDVYAVKLSEVLACLAAVKDALHAYRGGNIQGAFLTSEGQEEIDLGHHGTATYTVWATTATVTATTDSTGRVSTGPDTVTLAACGTTLRVDCEGVNVVGPGPYGGNPSSLVFRDYLDTERASVRYQNDEDVLDTRANAITFTSQTEINLDSPTVMANRHPVAVTDQDNAFSKSQSIVGPGSNALTLQVNDESTQGSVTFTAAGDSVAGITVSGDGYDLTIHSVSGIQVIGGTTTFTTASNDASVSLFSGVVSMTGKIGTNTTTTTTTHAVGTAIRRLPLYDTGGNLLGYVPVYDAIN